MKSLVACTFALQLQQTADFLSFADKAQEMSGNNNLQKGLRLTKPKGVQLFPTIVPKVFSKSDVCRATCFYLRNSFKATVVSTEISVK